MDLQLALLLIGVIIIAVVALTALERSRFGRRRLVPEAPAPRSPEALTHVRGPAAAPAVVPPAATLDLHVAPDRLAQDRVLKPDGQFAVTVEKTAEAVLSESLNDFEQAALMPLDLSLGLNDPETELAGEGVRQSMPDEHIDMVVTLPGRGPVARDLALGVYRQNEYLLDKPRHIFGLGYKTGLWSNLERDPEHAQYNDLALAIQLVDSKGPINESEINTFSQMALKLADTLQRPTRFSLPFEEAVTRAAELDEFCEANDVLASLNIVALGPTGFSGRAIDQVARHFGLQFGAMNIYHKKNDHAVGCRHLFSLANLYQPGEFNPAKLDRFRTRGLTLFMNVPCAYQPVHVFDDMVATARGLAKMLEGQLLDNEHRPLTDTGLLVIRSQIERIANEMTNRGIVPGSATAMRLFG